jgi:hypothetical protein
MLEHQGSTMTGREERIRSSSHPRDIFSHAVSYSADGDV